MNHEIKDLIKQYALVYKKFENIQSANNTLLPGGDQKTGVIAEYYAKCFIENNLGFEAEYAKSGESFDLKYQSECEEIKVQVKAVSAYSKTRTIAPLNLNEGAFDFLYLISLDENFAPNGFYINTYQNLKNKADGKLKIQGSILKGTTINGLIKPGSTIYDFTDDRIVELKKAIME